jgi:phosphoserine phosphatase RsbU/P
MPCVGFFFEKISGRHFCRSLRCIFADERAGADAACLAAPGANGCCRYRPVAEQAHFRCARGRGGYDFGYAFFLWVFITEGRRYFRVHAEIALAAEIHQVIVPPIETKMGGYEFYGRSVPSGEVGGDLVDVAGTEENWVAYLADVSGHGVAPGVVMGMVKSAARMLLSSGDDSRHLMARLNEVLYPLKKPDMFATFCFVARNGDGLRVGLAGHHAILNFSARTGAMTALECPNMPLGILPEGEFVTSEIATEAGDLFAMYTDGLLEAANAAGEEFGVARFQGELQKHGKEPLEVIYRSLQESVTRHGAQFDDQSVLLVRRV